MKNFIHIKNLEFYQSFGRIPSWNELMNPNAVARREKERKEEYNRIFNRRNSNEK